MRTIGNKTKTLSLSPSNPPPAFPPDPPRSISRMAEYLAMYNETFQNGQTNDNSRAFLICLFIFLAAAFLTESLFCGRPRKKQKEKENAEPELVLSIAKILHTENNSIPAYAEEKTAGQEENKNPKIPFLQASQVLPIKASPPPSPLISSVDTQPTLWFFSKRNFHGCCKKITLQQTARQTAILKTPSKWKSVLWSNVQAPYFSFVTDLSTDVQLRNLTQIYDLPSFLQTFPPQTPQGLLHLGGSRDVRVGEGESEKKNEVDEEKSSGHISEINTKKKKIPRRICFGIERKYLLPKPNISSHNPPDVVP